MQGFRCERWLELGNPTKRPPKISDPRVGPPQIGRLDLDASGGDIGTGECACREAGIAPRPWVKSRKNDSLFIPKETEKL